MPLKKILCAVDDSKVTKAVASCAVEIAAGSGATLTFLSVETMAARLRRAHFWDPRRLDAADAARHKGFAPALKAAKAQGFDGFDCVSVLGSDVADAIIAYADKMKADHIVIGTHTTSQLARIFVGSVATAVLSHARAPVTVVK
ncbi:nucleotide-binding universal stress UspA family protein [Dongia mobilis]|uniref:Nucleotide-binding universal stress UspA family protein n=1 Tax=Dongia mobilis TaxID=578943 RepID=A0A4R6WRC7_9PROT|nr:universal stress protein [Dongia mobilis]TDQ82011.1 nucleotide-binding universal stress UspA family protein [Dongia mobilis]